MWNTWGQCFRGWETLASCSTSPSVPVASPRWSSWGTSSRRRGQNPWWSTWRPSRLSWGRRTWRAYRVSLASSISTYRRFIPAAARILLLLTSALGGTGMVSADGGCLEAAKAALCRVMSLAHSDPSAAISLACNASDSHVVLQQWSPKGWQPLSFYSKKLDVTQKKYSTFDRELLAVYLAVRHFWFLLEGRQCHVEKDHKPLTFALHRLSEPWSARQQRQLSYLAQFTSDIWHLSGQSNVVADALSRPLPGGIKVPSGSPLT